VGRKGPAVARVASAAQNRGNAGCPALPALTCGGHQRLCVCCAIFQVAPGVQRTNWPHPKARRGKGTPGKLPNRPCIKVQARRTCAVALGERRPNTNSDCEGARP